MKRVIQEIRKDLNKFQLFLMRKQLKKINFIEKCNTVISKHLTFDEARIELAEFLEVVEINGQKKITIDNQYGRFMGVWCDEGKTLFYKEFRTRKFVH